MNWPISLSANLCLLKCYKDEVVQLLVIKILLLVYCDNNNL